MLMKNAAAWAAAALTAVVLAAGCTQSPAGPAAPQPASSSTTDVAVVASGLETPWSVAFHGTTPLVSARDSGQILALDGDGRTSVVTTVEETQAGGEGGLLGLAVQDGYLYAYLTAGDTNRIIRYRLHGEGTSTTVAASESVLDGIPAGSYHNGGRIAFGPDGMLYATAGDAYDSDNAQNRASLAGKILRMTPTGGVPSDNPFPRSLVYSLGHRNPQGIAWAEDGTMYATEFGQDTWDELNVIKPGGNYGWPVVEGIGNDDRYIDPVQQWRPADASPSGMTILDGSIWIANLRGASIRQVPLSDLSSSTRHYVGEYGRIRDLTVTPAGDLWAVTSNTDGSGDPGPDDDRILTIPHP